MAPNNKKWDYPRFPVDLLKEKLHEAMFSFLDKDAYYSQVSLEHNESVKIEENRQVLIDSLVEFGWSNNHE